MRIATVDLSKRIQQLLDERQKNEESIARIDDTLKQVRSALGVAGGKKLGRPVGRPKMIKTTDAEAPAKRGRRRRGRQRFELSGESAVLAFIKQNKTPTTQEINRHWKSAGRGGTADNALTKLVKLKQLKRERLEGQRGSRYSIA